MVRSQLIGHTTLVDGNILALTLFVEIDRPVLRPDLFARRVEI